MRKKTKIISISVVVFLICIFVLINTSSRWLKGKISSVSSDKIKIERISCSPAGIKIKKLSFLHPTNKYLKFHFDKFHIRPSLIRFIFRNDLAFAFSGPGKIKAGENENKIKITGKISGNFKGDIKIERTLVKLEKIGTVDIIGNLGKWGKEQISAKIIVSQLSLKDLFEFLQISYPLAGKVNGVLDLVIDESEKIQQLIFDVRFTEMYFDKADFPFKGRIKGKHNFSEKKTKIYEGVLESDKGSITFAGEVNKENFDLTFDSEGIAIEEVLKYLPDNLRKKYGVNGEGKLRFDKFSIKKN